jgi:hypothetical protein
MTTPRPVDRGRWWNVIGYEVSMLRELTLISSTIWPLGNSISEGRVLHTRNLCDFCTSERGNDIKPSDLFDDYDADPKYERLRSLIEHLREQYGDWKTQGAPRWVFDKMLAHPTKERRTSFDYTRSLNRVLPVLNDIIGEMETLRGHRFAVLSTQPAQP